MFLLIRFISGKSILYFSAYSSYGIISYPKRAEYPFKILSARLKYIIFIRNIFIHNTPKSSNKHFFLRNMTDQPALLQQEHFIDIPLRFPHHGTKQQPKHRVPFSFRTICLTRSTPSSSKNWWAHPE